MSAGAGLSKVTDADLKRLLKALHRGALRFPITRSGLIEAAFGHTEEHLDSLLGLEHAAAQALVVAVLAERSGRRAGHNELVLSAPAAPGTRSRDTRERVRELLAGAQHTALLLGVRAAEDRGLLQTLLAIAEPRGVEVTLVLEGDALPEGFEAPEVWRVYTSGDLGWRSRAVAVDRTRALVTSDVLSGVEDDATLHLGALIDDQAWVAQLLEELERLVKSERLKPLK